MGELVTTADGSLTIRHPGHSETYHSTAGADTEARELYISSSGILNSFGVGQPTHVLDVGLGLAYNAMATIEAWLDQALSGELILTSLEHCRELVEALRLGKAGWMLNWSPRRAEIVAALCLEGDGSYLAQIVHPVSGANCRWEILVGDARGTVKKTTRRYHYIWQDPFSPEKNPEMWGKEWFSVLATLSAPEAILMSYSVARVVRDALGSAGWAVERFKTPVREKRHWLRARPESSQQ